MLESFIPKFDRTRVITKELLDVTNSTTAKIMQNYIPQVVENKKNELEPVAFLIISQKILFNPSCSQSLKKEISEQLLCAVRTIIENGKQNKISKELFFAKVWKMNYKEDLHLPNIKSLLNRIKKDLGIKVGIRNGEICLMEEVILI